MPLTVRQFFPVLLFTFRTFPMPLAGLLWTGAIFIKNFGFHHRNKIIL